MDFKAVTEGISRRIVYLIEIAEADGSAVPRTDLAGTRRPGDQINHFASVFGSKDDGTFAGNVEVEGRCRPPDRRSPDRPRET
jgi:hypothetical protein